MTSDQSRDEDFVLLRVLVADSGSSVNDGLTALLSDLDGISVFGCTQDMEKLMTLARSLNPDAVILDLQRTEPIDRCRIVQLKGLPSAPIVIALCEVDCLPRNETIGSIGIDHILPRTDCDALLRLLEGLIIERRGNAR